MTEAEMWQTLRVAAEKQGLFGERYENVASYGTFDTSFSWDNKTLWVELKADVKKVLKLSQRRWARKRFEAGCTEDMYIVFCGKNHGWYAQRVDTYLQHDQLSYHEAAEFVHVAQLVDFLVTKMEQINGSGRVLSQ